MPKMFDNLSNKVYTQFCCFVDLLCSRKVLKEISVGDIKPDETVDAVKEARLLANVRYV